MFELLKHPNINASHANSDGNQPLQYFAKHWCEDSAKSSEIIQLFLERSTSIEREIEIEIEIEIYTESASDSQHLLLMVLV